MTKEDILSHLCYWDKRNPDCTADDEAIEDHKKQMAREAKRSKTAPSCYCDNCFYGNTKLAEHILMIQKIKGL